ncbi:uncharacterized protein V1518DRAFT_426454 [Limtongia smithiae]|uniref:uncharacterized protein n=1 Tax=Limtongia smithiae TaxID=1125753 RepID=UPI0034CD6520
MPESFPAPTAKSTLETLDKITLWRRFTRSSTLTPPHQQLNCALAVHADYPFLRQNVHGLEPYPSLTLIATRGILHNDARHACAAHSPKSWKERLRFMFRVLKVKRRLRIVAFAAHEYPLLFSASNSIDLDAHSCTSSCFPAAGRQSSPTIDYDGPIVVPISAAEFGANPKDVSIIQSLLLGALGDITRTSVVIQNFEYGNSVDIDVEIFDENDTKVVDNTTPTVDSEYFVEQNEGDKLLDDDKFLDVLYDIDTDVITYDAYPSMDLTVSVELAKEKDKSLGNDLFLDVYCSVETYAFLYHVDAPPDLVIVVEHEQNEGETSGVAVLDVACAVEMDSFQYDVYVSKHFAIAIEPATDDKSINVDDSLVDFLSDVGTDLFSDDLNAPEALIAITLDKDRMTTLASDSIPDLLDSIEADATSCTMPFEAAQALDSAHGTTDGDGRVLGPETLESRPSLEISAHTNFSIDVDVDASIEAARQQRTYEDLLLSAIDWQPSPAAQYIAFPSVVDRPAQTVLSDSLRKVIGIYLDSEALENFGSATISYRHGRYIYAPSCTTYGNGNGAGPLSGDLEDHRDEASPMESASSFAAAVSDGVSKWIWG